MQSRRCTARTELAVVDVNGNREDGLRRLRGAEWTAEQYRTRAVSRYLRGESSLGTRKNWNHLPSSEDEDD